MGGEWGAVLGPCGWSPGVYSVENVCVSLCYYVYGFAVNEVVTYSALVRPVVLPLVLWVAICVCLDDAEKRARFCGAKQR